MKFNVDMENRREPEPRSGWYRWSILVLLLVCAAGVWYAGWKLTRVAGDVREADREVFRDPDSERQTVPSGGPDSQGNTETHDEGKSEAESPASDDGHLSGAERSTGDHELEPLPTASDEVTFDEVVENRFFWPQRVAVLEDVELPVLYERIRVAEASLNAGSEYFVLRVLDNGVAVLVDGDEVVVPFGLTDLMERVEPTKDEAREAYRIEQQRGFFGR